MTDTNYEKLLKEQRVTLEELIECFEEGRRERYEMVGGSIEQADSAIQ